MFKRTLTRCSVLALVVMFAAGAANAYHIDNFDISQTYKSARALYRVLGDTTLGPDAAVYSAASVTLQWPTQFGGQDVSALQDSLLLQFMMYPGHDADSAITTILDHPVHWAEGTLLPVDTVPDGDMVRVLDFSLDIATVGYCDNFIVYRADYYSNEGGVHPNFFIQYLNYDICNNRVLSFNDIFAPGNDDELLKIVGTALCDRYYADDFRELTRKTDIYTDELFVSRDIYLTGDQIVFNYDPYDIAPWAVGVVEVPVNIRDLVPYLTPEAKTLYHLQ